MPSTTSYLSFEGQSFKGAFDPDEADEWIKKIKKIYLVSTYSETQKVVFAAYMLKLDAKFWWKRAKSLLESDEKRDHVVCVQSNLL